MKNIEDISNSILEEGLNEIDQELKDDEEIRHEAEYIAKQLLSNPVVTINYENVHCESEKDRFEEYELAVRSNKSLQCISLIALSKTKQKAIAEYNQTALKPKVYTPMILNAEMDKDFTYEQILNTLVSAFLCKLRGVFKVEILEN